MHRYCNAVREIELCTDWVRQLKEKPEGAIIRESEVASEPGAIDQWLKTIGLPVERVGMEAGGLSSWLCHELLASGWPMICMETRHAKAAMKAQQVKTDRNDARGLAHIMRTGWFREVHIKSHDSQELRMLLKPDHLDILRLGLSAPNMCTLSDRSFFECLQAVDSYISILLKDAHIPLYRKIGVDCGRRKQTFAADEPALPDFHEG